MATLRPISALVGSANVWLSGSMLCVLCSDAALVLIGVVLRSWIEQGVAKCVVGIFT